MVIRKRRAILDAKGCANSVKEVEQVMSSEGLGSPVVAIDGQEVAVAIAVDHVVEEVSQSGGSCRRGVVGCPTCSPMGLRWDYQMVLKSDGNKKFSLASIQIINLTYFTIYVRLTQ